MFVTLHLVQKISFGNREYVKASEAAKRFKYTQDYIGQLCRGDKVDARLVGRVWYVNLESITEYRKTKHTTQKKAAKTSVSQKTKSKGLSVEPVVRAKTARKLQEAFPGDASRAVKHVSAKYSKDDGAIIPVLGAKPTNTEPVVDRAPQKRPSVVIKVKPNTRKTTVYHTEKIPEITLKSKLKVTDDIKDHVPKTVTDVRREDVPDQTRDTAPQPYRVVVSPATQKPAQKSVNFHPQSVSTKNQPTAKQTLSAGQTAAPKKKRRIRLLASFLYMLGLMSVALLVLGLSHFNETGSVAPLSGVTFSVEVALEKVLEILQ